jgi:hypothetical protein
MSRIKIKNNGRSAGWFVSKGCASYHCARQITAKIRAYPSTREYDAGAIEVKRPPIGPFWSKSVLSVPFPLQGCIPALL